MSEFLGEHDHEPVRGLPGPLPPGEALLWQGSPDAWLLARDVFHLRVLIGYFLAFAVWRVLVGISDGLAPMAVVMGAGIVVLMGALLIGALVAYAALMANSTVFSITNRRVVVRYGLTLPKTWNLPFGLIRSASLRCRGRGRAGDVCLELPEEDRIGYLMLWPFARPGKLLQPQPMLRALPDAKQAATVLSDALQASLSRAARAETPVAPTFVPAGTGASPAAV
ncbi:MAG: photosynthetic complex putative assembly protein PuhB [Pseudomonadota bacterium]